MPIQSNVAALRLGDLEQVATHTGKADGLSRSRAFIRRWHLFQIKVVDAEENGSSDKNYGKTAHALIVPRAARPHNQKRTRPCIREQPYVLSFRFRTKPACRHVLMQACRE